MKSVIKTQTGFTMIESLLTLFILSVGMLGIAGLQVQSLRSGSVAMQRMAVAIKAQEMMDRVRANMVEKMVGSTGAQTDKEILLNARQQTIAIYASATAANSPCMGGTVCDEDAMAAYDLYQLEYELDNLLPGTPTPTITVNNSNITITITWTDRGDAFSYSVTSQI
jgi:type IV pilus assembly protein PilV